MVGSVESYLGRRGGPIRYAYAAGEWGLDAYQTIFGVEPGSAEMPSAGRPFTARTLAALAARDVQVIPIVLHCGVSSLEDHESPLPSGSRLGRVRSASNGARGAGGRVIAVGTTAVRALESAAGADGQSTPRPAGRTSSSGPSAACGRSTASSPDGTSPGAPPR